MEVSLECLKHEFDGCFWDPPRSSQTQAPATVFTAQGGKAQESQMDIQSYSLLMLIVVLKSITGPCLLSQT